MRTKLLLFVFLFSCKAVFSNNELKNGLEISLAFKPSKNYDTFLRGISIEKSNYINDNIGWSISGRTLNNGYTALWTSLCYNIKPTTNIIIPIDFGTGLKIKSLDLNSNNQEGLDLLIHCKSGVRWVFNKNWSYNFTGSYNYNIFGDIKHNLFINIGISYLYQ